MLGSVHPQIHWYGLMYLLAFATAWWLGQRRVRAGRLPGVNEQAFGDLVFYGALGVVLGGRLGYILFYDLPTYLDQPLQVLQDLAGRHELPRRSARRRLRRVVVVAPAQAAFVRHGGFHRAAGAAGSGLRPPRQLHQRRAVGQADRPAWGVVFPTDPAVPGHVDATDPGTVRQRRAGPVRAPSVAAVPGGPRRAW